MRLFEEVLISAIFLLVLDAVFIYLNQKIFIDQVISVQRTALIIKPAGFIACYLFLMSGLYYFIIRNRKSPWEAFLFGLFTYGVYETTTYTILKNWSLKTVILDTLWGGVLMYLVTWLSYKFI